MDGADPTPGSRMASLRRLAETLLAIVQNRLELAAVELGEEKYRVLDALMWAGVFVFLAVMTMLLATLMVVFIFREYALLALAGLGFCYFVATVAVFFILRRRLREWPIPFVHTVAEIKKDRECLSDPK